MKDTLLNRVECDFCEVHSFLSKLQHIELPFEELLRKSVLLLNQYSPSKLQQATFLLSKRYLYLFFSLEFANYV